MFTFHATSKVSTFDANRVIKRLSNHWKHKNTVEFVDATDSLQNSSALIKFEAAECELYAHENYIQIKVHTPTQEALERMKNAVADHIMRMANPEELVIKWDI
ncbi:hypothetical protein AwWohl_06200 [Gammaproteobacteria bacterium]|nr:hypothetical protein AwWohl_06200 [Gammaproteobacteria bacterium]